jgi:hypothetical protein
MRPDLKDGFAFDIFFAKRAMDEINAGFMTHLYSYCTNKTGLGQTIA